MYASRALLRQRPPQVSPVARRGGHRWPLQAGMVVALACLPLACGKKGPPLAPLVRIPQPVQEIAVRRIDADVYLRLRVPSQNRDGSTPADVVRVDLFALTADAPPSPETLQQRGTRIASVPIAAVATEPESAPAAAASQAGVKPGDEVVVRDTLGPAALVPTPPPPAAGATPATGDTNAATTAPAADVRRYYMAFAFSGRDRRSAPGKQISVTVATAPPPPADLSLKHTPSAAVVTWSGVSADDTYDLYRVTREPAAPEAGGVRMPTPINQTPLQATTFSEPYTYGEERCFHVRTRRTAASGETVESAASATRCHTPQDDFAPAPPADLQALPGAGEITLIWSPNAEPDIAGYLVLRGRAGDDTLAEITASPVTGTRYVDRTVMPGVRYVYAVIAVDTRAPEANRSAESARDETTAR